LKKKTDTFSVAPNVGYKNEINTYNNVGHKTGLNVIGQIENDYFTFVVGHMVNLLIVTIFS